MTDKNDSKNWGSEKKDSSSSKAWQAEEFKSLIQNQGKVKVAGKEWELKAPSYSDPSLQQIIKDPRFTAKPIGTPGENGKWTYELWGNGKTAKVTIGWFSSH